MKDGATALDVSCPHNTLLCSLSGEMKVYEPHSQYKLCTAEI